MFTAFHFIALPNTLSPQTIRSITECGGKLSLCFSRQGNVGVAAESSSVHIEELFKKLISLRIPIVFESWVASSHQRKSALPLRFPFAAFDPNLLFGHCITTSGFTFEKETMKHVVRFLGGVYSKEFTLLTTLLVVRDTRRTSSKREEAIKRSVPVISLSYFFDCILRNSFLDASLTGTELGSHFAAEILLMRGKLSEEFQQ